MSEVRDKMLAAANRRDWNMAYLNANGLSMTELLSGLAALSQPLFTAFKAGATGFHGGINMARVQYAMQVVQTHTLPSVAPGDLAVTGQVDVARKFLAGGADTSAGLDGLPAIIRALDENRLRAPMNNVAGQLRALAASGSWMDKTGNTLRASAGLVHLLAGLLARGGTMTIMSLFRFKGGPHGEVQGDGSAIGRAVDIMMYRGYEIHLKSPANASNAIEGVAAVIGNLPTGRYTVGLPRPGGQEKIDPPNDVFFKVTSHSQVDTSPGKSLARDLDLLLEPAQRRLRSATASSAGKIQFMFPDGVDHVHVKALD